MPPVRLVFTKTSDASNHGNQTGICLNALLIDGIRRRVVLDAPNLMHKFGVPSIIQLRIFGIQIS